MFIINQNFGFGALEKLLSLEISASNTGDTGSIDVKEFASLLTHLIAQGQHEEKGVTEEMGAVAEMSVPDYVKHVENLSAEMETEINADLIIQGDYGENGSIPVKIVVREQHEENGQNTVVLALFIDTSGLNNTEIEKVNSLLNLQTSNMLDASDIINKMSGDAEHSLAAGKPVNQHNFYDYEGHAITNNESAHEIDEFPVVSSEKISGDKTPSNFSNFSQIFPIDPDSGDSEVTNRVDNIGAEKISASISKPEIKEFDVSKAYLHKEHYDIQSGENYINTQGDVRVSVQKFVIEAAADDSEGAGFVLHTSSDKTPLVLKPQNTAFTDSPLLKLLQKYSSSGEKIEIAVVMSPHSSVMSGSEANSGTDAAGKNHVPIISSDVEKIMVDKIIKPGSDVDISRKVMSNQDLAKQLNVKMIKSPGVNEGLNITHEYSETENPKLFYSGGELDGQHVETEIVQGSINEPDKHVQNPQMPNRFPITSEMKTDVNSIKADYAVPEDGNNFSGIVGDGGGNHGEETVRIAGIPEAAGGKQEMIQENTVRIITHSEEIVQDMTRKTKITSAIRVPRDYSVTQSAEKVNGLENSHAAFQENMELTGNSPGRAIISDSAEAFTGNNGNVEDFLPAYNVKEPSVESSVNSKNTSAGSKITGEMKDSAVSPNGNLMHVDRTVPVSSDTRGSDKAVKAEAALPTAGADNSGVEAKQSELNGKHFNPNPQPVNSFSPDNANKSQHRAFNPLGSEDIRSDTTIGENNEVKVTGTVRSIGSNMAETVLRYSDTEKAGNRKALSTENIQPEVDAPSGSGLTSDTGGKSALSVFQQNPELLYDGEFSQQKMSGFEKQNGNVLPDAAVEFGEQNFGIPGVSENSVESVFDIVMSNSGHEKIYRDVNENQILNSIVRHARFMYQKGVSKAVIKLEPPSLGKLILDIVTENSKVTGRIIVESTEVRNIIQNSISELRESLAQNGLKVDSFDVQVGHNDGTDNLARREQFKYLLNSRSNTNALNGAASVTAEEQAALIEPIQNKSIYSEFFDVRI